MIIPPKFPREPTKLSARPLVATRLDVLDITHHAVPVEVRLDCAPTCRAHSPPQRGVCKQAVECLGDCWRAVRIDQQSSYALEHCVEQASCSTAHHGNTRRRVIHRRDPEPLYEQIVASRHER